jgi:hypothetical protein
LSRNTADRPSPTARIAVAYLQSTAGGL